MQLSSVGSSPLTRGKPDLVANGVHFSGLIPAHAGKTKGRPRTAPQASAHPRSRGENVAAACHSRRLTGSSPLTRGKRGRSARPDRCPGLIPAHAGKTRTQCTTRPVPRAHPRSRGENDVRRENLVFIPGSSPLTRGKLDGLHCVSPSEGLIPAHAGKTYCQDCQALILPAHPRSRGENGRIMADTTSGAGSSPLTRGKPTRSI